MVFSEVRRTIAVRTCADGHQFGIGDCVPARRRESGISAPRESAAQNGENKGGYGGAVIGRHEPDAAS